MTDRERVDTSVEEVPVPKYYLARNDTGLWHLVDPREFGRVKHGDADSVTTRCDTSVPVAGADDLKHVTEWLEVEDVVENYTADELWDEFKPFAAQCKNCLKSHRSDGATDFASLNVPEDYSPPR